MWFFTSLSPIVLILTLAASAAAQYTPAPGGTGGYGPPGEQPPGGQYPGDEGGGRSGWRRGQRGEMNDLPTPTMVEGPASPAVMRDTIGLTGQPADRYAQRYANYMADTRSIRDSLKTNLEAMRTAMGDQDRSVAREHAVSAQELWKDLSKRDQEFEKNCQDLLTKEQQKHYKKWKEAQEKAAREHWKNRRGSGAGSGR